MTLIEKHLDTLYHPIFLARKHKIQAPKLNLSTAKSIQQKVISWLTDLERQLDDKQFICGDK